MMTNIDCMELLRTLSRQVCDSVGNSEYVRMNPLEKTGNGRTRFCFDEVEFAYVGIKELDSNPNGFVNQYTFMKAFISVLHESTHVYQQEKILHMKNPSARCIAIGSLAEQCSYQYYEDNYKLMPQEISAQYSALKNGYDILSDWFGREKANDMICDYVNKHIEDEFVSKPVKSYEDVYDIFRDYKSVFRTARHVVREVNLESLMEFAKESDSSDVMSKKLRNGNMLVYEGASTYKGANQDFLLAGCCLSYADGGREARQMLESVSGINFLADLSKFMRVPKKMRNVNLDDVTPNLSNISIDGSRIEFL